MPPKWPAAFYGPFREAADSAPQFGDRRTYQMDGGNFREAMREIDEDVAEGADMLLIKPALPYLDVSAPPPITSDCPPGAYQVSGEYAMLQAAFARNWLDPGARNSRSPSPASAARGPTSSSPTLPSKRPSCFRSAFLREARDC